MKASDEWSEDLRGRWSHYDSFSALVAGGAFALFGLVFVESQLPGITLFDQEQSAAAAVVLFASIFLSMVSTFVRKKEHYKRKVYLAYAGALMLTTAMAIVLWIMLF